MLPPGSAFKISRLFDFFSGYCPIILIKNEPENVKLILFSKTPIVPSLDNLAINLKE